MPVSHSLSQSLHQTQLHIAYNDWPLARFLDLFHPEWWHTMGVSIDLL